MTNKKKQKVRFSGNLVGLFLALAFLGLAGHAYFDYASDDAFVSFRYARHLAEGKGLVWNIGEKLESYSNFPWVVILAVSHLVGFDILLSSKVLGILAGIGLLVAVYELAREVAGSTSSSDSVTVASVRESALCHPLWLAPVALAFNRDVIFWMPSGMETILFAFLLVAAAHRYLVEIRTPNKFPLSSLLFLLVAITRPEGIVYFLATLAFDLAYRRQMRWRALLVLLVPLCIYHLWRVIYFGDLLPCPYYAKIGGDERFATGVGYVGAYLVKYLLPFAVLSLLILFPPKHPERILYLFWLMIAGTAAVLWMDGDWMWHFRLLIPVTALLAVLMVPAVSGPLAAATGADRRAPWVVLLLGLLVLHQATGVPGIELARVVTLTRQPMSGGQEGEMTLAMKAAAFWIRDHSEPDDLIAVNHAGALPYYAERPALDMTGLCDRHISRLSGSIHLKYDPNYVLSRAPRYVVLNTMTRPVNGSYGRDYWIGENALYDHPLFLKQYAPLPRYWAWRWDAIDPEMSYIMVFERAEQRVEQNRSVVD